MKSIVLSIIAQKIKNNTTNHIVFYENQTRKSKSYSELYEDAGKVITYFQETLGLTSGKRVGIVADNSYEWIVVDVACYFMGLQTVPFHKTDFKEESMHAVFEKFELDYMIVDFSCINNHGTLQNKIFVMEKIQSVIADQVKKREIDVYPFEEEETMTIVSTSGTTSESKFIEISSKPFNDFMSYGIDMYGLNEKDKIIVFIPLSHYGQRIYIYGAMVIGFDIILCDIASIQITIRREKPTLLVAVPYFYETIFNVFYEKINQKKITRLAYDYYMKNYKHLSKRIKNIYQKKMLKPFQDVFGGNMRIMITGSAPISTELLEFYHKMDLSLYEGYGTNETGLIALSYPGCYKSGSVGKLCPNKEIKFDENGQIFVRGDACWAREYYKFPKEENRKVFMEDGFIATGDSGFMDEEGFIFIDGRIKDWIVLKNGKKVNPIEIEEQFEKVEHVDHVILYGDSKPYIVAMVFGNQIQEKEVKKQIDLCNQSLPEYARIKDFRIFNEKLSLENKTLNSSLKIVRKNIYSVYQDEMDMIYE